MTTAERLQCHTQLPMWWVVHHHSSEVKLTGERNQSPTSVYNTTPLCAFNVWCDVTGQHQWFIKYENYSVTLRCQHYSSLSKHWLFLTKNTQIQFKYWNKTDTSHLQQNFCTGILCLSSKKWTTAEVHFWIQKAWKSDVTWNTSYKQFNL